MLTQTSGMESVPCPCGAILLQSKPDESLDNDKELKGYVSRLSQDILAHLQTHIDRRDKGNDFIHLLGKKLADYKINQKDLLAIAFHQIDQQAHDGKDSSFSSEYHPLLTYGQRCCVIEFSREAKQILK